MTTINDKQKIYLAKVAKKQKQITFLKKNAVTSAKVKVAQNLGKCRRLFLAECAQLSQVLSPGNTNHRRDWVLFVKHQVNNNYRMRCQLEEILPCYKNSQFFGYVFRSGILSVVWKSKILVMGKLGGRLGRMSNIERRSASLQRQLESQ